MANPIKDLQKVGEAKLSFLFWDVYDSALYSANGVFEPDAYPLALRIRYLRDIEAQDLVDHAEKEWKKLGFTQEQAAPWLSKIQGLWPDISEGDELLLVVEENRQSQFYFNDSLLVNLEDTSFGPNFLAIWLDEKCSYPKLRNKLVGKTK